MGRTTMAALGELEGLVSARVSIKPEPDPRYWLADHADQRTFQTSPSPSAVLLPVPSNLVTIILGHLLPILETD